MIMFDFFIAFYLTKSNKNQFKAKFEIKYYFVLYLNKSRLEIPLMSQIIEDHAGL